jgi:hypothetical protein
MTTGLCVGLVRTVYITYVHGSTPPQKLFIQFCTATAIPPLAETSRRVQRVQAGLGLVVQGQAELGLGGLGNAGKVRAGIPDHSSEGFLTTHRSHCSKSLISATAPQPPLLEINIY